MLKIKDKLTHLKMEKVQKFKLINGTFNAYDAKSVLFTLLNSKINFHSMESFGITIRTGGDTSFHEKRIKELKKANNNIKKMLDFAVKNGLEVDMHSDIKINLKNVKKRISKDI